MPVIHDRSSKQLSRFLCLSCVIWLSRWLVQSAMSPSSQPRQKVFFFAFQSPREGSLMLIISKLLIVLIAKRFWTVVCWGFSWLNPLSQAADDTGRTLRVWTKSHILAVMHGFSLLVSWEIKHNFRNLIASDRKPFAQTCSLIFPIQGPFEWIFRPRGINEHIGVRHYTSGWEASRNVVMESLENWFRSFTNLASHFSEYLHLQKCHCP